ncbi:MAG TPA: AAA family ATPase [Accumulibacter sp.]|nr:AAA family ATPase [Accumulibacter sp.]
MKPATREELRAEIPAVRDPNPVAILDRLESLIASGLNVGLVEKRTGISESTLHALLDDRERSSLGMVRRDNWFDERNPSKPGPLDNARRDLHRLNAWMDADADERRKMAARQYTEIETGLYIAGLAMEALEKKRLFHLIGGYGICKTTTLQRFAGKHPMTHETPGAVFLALTEEDRTPAQVYRRVGEAIRISEKFQTRGRSLGQRVRNTLRPGDLVIVDEANYAFERGTWATLRDIFDSSQASLMMVSNTTSNGFVKRNQDELGAFLSRARTRLIDRNQASDGERYARALGYTCPRIIAEAARIVTVRGANGGMRTLAKAFEDAEQMATQKGVAVDLAIVKEAAKINSVFFR